MTTRKKKDTRRANPWRRPALYIFQRTFRSHETLHQDVQAFARMLARELKTDVVNHSEACRVLLRLGLEHYRAEIERHRPRRPRRNQEACVVEDKRLAEITPRDLPVAAE